MELETFQAKTVAEALAEVKRRFGEDAVVLHTRTVRRGGVLGYGGHRMVEITAGKNSFSLPASQPGARLQGDSGEMAEVDGATDLMAETPPRGLTGDWDAGGASTEIGRLSDAVADLLRETRSVRDPSLPEELDRVYEKLIQNQVTEEIAGQLVSKVRASLSQERLQDPAAVRTALASFVESMLPSAGPIRMVDTGQPTIIALIGPTGVGKTTTIAKLAANYRLRQGRKVGLITFDTSRIAAVEQLRTYAQIIDVPLEVVAKREQTGPAVDRLGDCDVILIDTAGKSQNDRNGLMELKKFLDAAKPHEVHLVLSGAYGAAVLHQMVERFSTLMPNRILFTKLDEAVGFGVILGCLQRARTQLSYITTGQEVPDAIEVSRPSRLAELILSQRDTVATGAEEWSTASP